MTNVHGLIEATWEEVQPHVDRVIVQLPAAQHESVVLHFLQGLTLDQVAAVMGHSPGTVSVWLGRALKTLQRKLRREGTAVSDATLAAWLGSKARAGARTAPD
jgi:DNA-directed RNA polymerase specialized sigma24 family protein